MERPEDKPTDIWAGSTGGWMDRWMNGWTDKQARLKTDRDLLTARRMDRYIIIRLI